MADRRTSGGSERQFDKKSAVRAASVGRLLKRECWSLLDFYSKRENLPADVGGADPRLVSVPPPSSQLDSRDQLWRLHVALLQCRSLMESAIAKEDEELGAGQDQDQDQGQYASLRSTVKERLKLLAFCVSELLGAGDGPAVPTPASGDSLERADGSLFELKLLVLRIFQEVDYWAKTAVAILQTLSKEPARNTRLRRSIRSTRR
ncbi:ciliary neurotrophic factor [Entelurus aequoreus]|uniref:ciliary neurotrophic factor n=1 Tax=Entelurus aequoreus TaxID=161455 RepID=UPI002B1E2118|nr:ciliary neurotrophic factor [Entelurus aequoreus]XP_061881972.1 ciliary neurotrophic factor [Entelurus aequoreus]